MAYYGICSGLPVVRASVAQQVEQKADSGLAYLLQAMTAIFPDFGRLDFKDSVLSSQLHLDAGHVLASSGVAGLYIVLTCRGNLWHVRIKHC